MNLALEVKDLYNENDKTLIKETIQHRDACTHTHTKPIQTHIHSYKITCINTHTYILMYTYKTRPCLGTKNINNVKMTMPHKMSYKSSRQPQPEQDTTDCFQIGELS